MGAEQDSPRTPVVSYNVLAVAVGVRFALVVYHSSPLVTLPLIKSRPEAPKRSLRAICALAMVGHYTTARLTDCVIFGTIDSDACRS